MLTLALGLMATVVYAPVTGSNGVMYVCVLIYILWVGCGSCELVFYVCVCVGGGLFGLVWLGVGFRVGVLVMTLCFVSAGVCVCVFGGRVS